MCLVLEQEERHVLRDLPEELAYRRLAPPLAGGRHVAPRPIDTRPEWSRSVDVLGVLMRPNGADCPGHVASRPSGQTEVSVLLSGRSQILDSKIQPYFGFLD